MKLRAVGLTESEFTFPSISRQRAIRVQVGEDGVLSIKDDDTGEFSDLPDDIAGDLLRDTSVGQFVIAASGKVDVDKIRAEKAEIVEGANDPNFGAKYDESDEAELYRVRDENLAAKKAALEAEARGEDEEE